MAFGFEIVSFHATGLGDRAAMELVPQGSFSAFIDLVPGAFSEYLLGGNRGISGSGRLDIASKIPIPYIFCPGGFDIISCGPIERKDKADPLWTSRKLAERKLYVQESPRVQARLSAEEMSFIATAAAERLNEYTHKKRVKIVIPRRGFSSIRWYFGDRRHNLEITGTIFFPSLVLALFSLEKAPALSSFPGSG